MLASNIRKYRLAMGLSQAKLAERVDTSAHYVSMLETKSKFPSPEMVERIAEALGIDSPDLFRPDVDPDDAIKRLRKAVLKDVGDAVGRFIEGQVRGLDPAGDD